MAIPSKTGTSATDAEKTLPERRIEAQIAEQGPADDRMTGITKSEQPLTETDVPDAATLSRGYYKFTDNNGNFRKVPVDGTNAIREPAHEQHELTVEDRDRLYEAAALKTPRRDNEAAKAIHDEQVHNDEYNAELTKSATPVDSIEADKSDIKDAGDQLHDKGEQVMARAGPTKGTVSESVDANARDNR
jgi:hypothetical protein